MGKVVRSIASWMGKQPQLVVFDLCLSLIMFLGLVDYFTGYEFSFSVFYLIPVAIAAWYTGKIVGGLVCVISAVTWLTVDFTSGHVYSYQVILYWNAFVRFSFFIITAYLLNTIKDDLAIVQQLSRLDALTGLMNSRAFEGETNRIIELASRMKHQMTFLYLDVDDFQVINDTRGHAEGDRLLKAIADKMKQSIRSYDLIARAGGDEFVVLLPETDAVAAKQVISKLHGCLLQLAVDNAWPIGFSIGAVTFEKSPSSIDQALQAADRLMYAVKRQGKNAVAQEVYNSQSK